MAIEVAGLYTYPIKSCAPIALDEARLTPRGLQYDRDWMVVGGNNQFLTQRVHPEMSLIASGLGDDTLDVTAPTGDQLAVPLDANETIANDIVEVDVFKKKGLGIDQGPEAAAFFSDYLGKRARLLRIVQPRYVNPDYRVPGATSLMGFADGFPILLASMVSLEALNEHLDEPISINRFRPNIVVDGSSLKAYDEDYWRTIQIGNLRAYVVRACDRCPVPNIDQAEGVLPKPADRAVTQVLRQTRHGIDPSNGKDGEFFAQNLVHEYTPGVTIRLGDKLAILKSSTKPNFEPLSSALSEHE